MSVKEKSFKWLVLKKKRIPLDHALASQFSIIIADMNDRFSRLPETHQPSVNRASIPVGIESVVPDSPPSEGLAAFPSSSVCFGGLIPSAYQGQ